MNKSVIKVSILVLISLTVLSSCQKKNCPAFWGPADNQQVASDGKNGSGENLGEADGERIVEFPMIRVKRDKNGIVNKEKQKRGKKKYEAPRKNWKPQQN